MDANEEPTTNHTQNIFAIIGAGPKGLATAVKAKVLSEFGFKVDRVILIEKSNIAAHWSGQHGYTNGKMKLGTSPEKDLVFPIETKIGSLEMNQKIHERLLFFSWTSYLINSGKYAEWIDRGKPSPCHKMWSQYLTWVSSYLEPEVKIIKSEVNEIDISDSRWKLNLVRGPIHETLYADKLMITGPGEVKADFKMSSHLASSGRVFDLKTFWNLVQSKNFPLSGRLAIVGAGENAASALIALDSLDSDLEIEIISVKGFVTTRSENFYENHFYSAPEKQGWSKLDIKDRIDFISRTDLGVFSVDAMSALNDQRKHKIVPGRVSEIRHDYVSNSLDQNFNEKIVLSIDYANTSTESRYDYVLLASGFNQVLFLKKLLTQNAIDQLQSKTGEVFSDETLSQHIMSDLSVSNFFPKLHLPMLAGVNQGPGFANLSCLGRLSDRLILDGLSEETSLHEKISTRNDRAL